MGSALQNIEVGLSARQKLAESVRSKSEVLTFDEDPALAGLCTAIGIQFEMGKNVFDRLSPFLGVELAGLEVNPYLTKLVVRDEKIGIQIFKRDGSNLTLKHPDFKYIIDKDSFNAAGELSSVLIFPVDVVTAFERRGFKLVVVREWIATSCLSIVPQNAVQYTYANRWEFETNVAKTQLALMTRSQLAFSGTHDIVDHLLGLDYQKFCVIRPLLSELNDTYEKVFCESRRPTEFQLLISYLVGILLDDLAQPRWYGSPSHQLLLKLCVKELSKTRDDSNQNVVISNSFQLLVDQLRSERLSFPELETLFYDFLQSTTSYYTETH